MVVDQICYKGKCIATIVHLKKEAPVRFLTDSKATIQAGIHYRLKGTKVPAHVHRAPPVRKHNIREILLVLQGSAQVVFYTKQGRVIARRVLKRHDLLIQRELGHSFEVLKNFFVLEIKAGPYVYNYEKIASSSPNSR